MMAQSAGLDSQDLGLFSPFDDSGVTPGTNAIAICREFRPPATSSRLPELHQRSIQKAFSHVLTAIKRQDAYLPTHLASVSPNQFLHRLCIQSHRCRCAGPKTSVKTKPFSNQINDAP